MIFCCDLLKMVGAYLKLNDITGTLALQKQTQGLAGRWPYFLAIAEILILVELCISMIYDEGFP